VGATAGRQRRKRACEQHRKVRATHARTGARDKPAAKEDGRRRPTVEAGWSERWRLPTQNATWQASAAGDQNLKRGVRLVVHLFRLAAVRSTVGYATETGAPNRTGGASLTRSARACFGSSEQDAGRSRAGAPKRTPTTADDAAELTPDQSVAAAPDRPKNPRTITDVHGRRPKPIRPQGPSGPSSAAAKAHGRDDRA
jgi:hypothetical protein